MVVVELDEKGNAIVPSPDAVIAGLRRDLWYKQKAIRKLEQHIVSLESTLQSILVSPGPLSRLRILTSKTLKQHT